MTDFVKCKVCGATMVRGELSIQLECCDGFVHWCGCDTKPFRNIAAFVAKFKRMHAVVCIGRKLS